MLFTTANSECDSSSLPFCPQLIKILDFIISIADTRKTTIVYNLVLLEAYLSFLANANRVQLEIQADVWNQNLHY
jgi:hypothetical protein